MSSSKIRPVRLNDFLARSNVENAEGLPFVHTAASRDLLDILADERLLATPCNVFTGEKLCYLFMGRPAYKLRDSESPSEWQLPSVFVVRFEARPSFKRVYPFDSGAFKGRRLPDYITCFNIDHYDMASHPTHVGRMMSIFYGGRGNYYKRRAVDLDHIREEHRMDASHQEVAALARLFKEGSTVQCDDRAAAIEFQLEHDISFADAQVLGIVMPAEYARIEGLRQSIAHITTNIEAYDLHPLSVANYYGVIYEAVGRIYKRHGIKL